MNETEIKQMKASTAKLTIYDTDGQKMLDSGTASLVDPYTAITARHVLTRLTDGGRAELSFPHMPSMKNVVVREIHRCQDERYDIAILQWDEELADGRVYPELYAVKPEGRSAYESHGFPSDRPHGCTLEGKLTDIYEQFTQNDLELNVTGREGMDFSGASGSPLFVNGGMYGIMIVRDTGNALGALSFAECRAFLDERRIACHTLPPLREYERIIVERQLPMAKVGFDEGENFPYMDTYATWENVTSLNSLNGPMQDKPELLPAMAERYFSVVGNERNILFVAADFGKGKSTFLRHLAAKMAEDYRDTREGPLPVYFNLREYTKYEKFGSLNLNKEGVIKDFLKETAGIDFANRQHPIFSQPLLFLVDSLDECGSLVLADVMQVIRSVKAIADYCSGARIIVTTRPIPNVLDQVIKEANQPVNQTWLFASIYGFQPDQFADYMKALHPKLPAESAHVYNRELLDTIRSGQSIYETFKGLLNAEELKRPILAYMLYKLLEEDYELEKGSKLGIYLSFINMLTKDAKHIVDSGRKDDWLKRLGYRNLLYVTAVMWMKNVHLNAGGFLRLRDLEEALGEDASLIQFMSHSYFRNTDGMYHFNHQSFAEIIIAEYYVRLLLWSALENKSENELRPFLAIGNPTEQTVSFVKSLLIMLCDATLEADKLDENSLQKMRRALSPMVSSLGSAEYNRPPDNDKDENAQRDGYIYSSYIRREWNAEQWGGFSEIPDAMLEKWPVKPEHIEKMIKNAAAIVNGKDDYVFFQPQRVNHSFNRDVYRIEGRKMTFNPDTERWIAMLCGTTLAERLSDDSAFPAMLDRTRVAALFSEHQNRTGYACPVWITTFPYHHNLEDPLAVQWEFEQPNLSGVVFEYIRIRNTALYKTNLNGSALRNVAVTNVRISGTGRGMEFTGCYFENVIFDNLSLEGAVFNESFFYNCSFRSVNLSGARFDGFFENILDFTDVQSHGSHISIYTDQDSYERLKRDRIFRNKIRFVKVREKSDLEFSRESYRDNAQRRSNMEEW